MALQQGYLTAVTRAGGRPAPPHGEHPAGPSRVFPGTADQLAAVRRHVRAELTGHPAAEDAVQAASGLAARAITQTASGHPGGLFSVHVTALSPGHAAVLVTSQSASRQPLHASRAATRRRGLATASAAILGPFGDGSASTILAIIGDTSTSDSQP